MARSERFLTRWQVVAVIAVAILILPLSAMNARLQARHPRVALALFIAGYSIVVGLIGFLAWGAWSMVLMSYRRHHDPASRSFPSRIKTLLREPWPLYFACLFTVGTVGAIAHLIREAVWRAI